LFQTKANKFPIGFRGEGEQEKFTNHSIDLQKGDTIYISSDGYADQFGGPKGKKFMAGNFRELLRKLAEEERMELQHAKIHKTIEDWRGELEQVDDIVIIGVRV
jgi:serine phosphatase RsbU (regulator of sigma subunit)